MRVAGQGVSDSSTPSAVSTVTAVGFSGLKSRKEAVSHFLLFQKFKKSSGLIKQINHFLKHHSESNNDLQLTLQSSKQQAFETILTDPGKTWLGPLGTFPPGSVTIAPWPHMKFTFKNI